MKFAEAFELARCGRRIAREGWNGKGQFVYCQEGSVIDPAQAKNPTLATLESPITIRPHLDLKTVDGSIIVGWTPSTGDLFAEDWVLFVDIG